jgi:hypothetical protein
MKFDDSRCKASWLHKFEIIGQYYNGVMERCERCSKKKFFRVDDTGRTNNRIYLSYHIRQALYPSHRLFAHEYPDSRLIINKGYNK